MQLDALASFSVRGAMPHTHNPLYPMLHKVRLSDGRILNVAEYGDGLGEPMLFLHGTPGSHLLAGLIAEEARANGFRVFAPDRPGLGESSPHLERTYGTFAQDLAEMLDHFNLPKAHLVGISGGGPYALAAAARIPERLKTLVLLSPWWFPYGHKKATDGLNPLFKLYAWLVRSAFRFTRPMSRLAAKLASSMPEKLIEQMIQHAPVDDQMLLASPAVQLQIEADITMSFRQGWEGQWREAVLCFEKPDIDVASITLPVTIFHGAEDNVVPLHYAEKLAAQLPNATLKIDPAGGHFVALRLQDEVFSLLNQGRG
jgi:pimeloyl-ACP methyl ester carboxylesterase